MAGHGRCRQGRGLMPAIEEVQVSRVVFDDGTTWSPPRTKPRPMDVMAWERHFGKASASLADIPTTPNGVPLLPLEEVLYLLWLQARRAGRAGDDFDAWADTITDLDVAPAEAPEPVVPSAPGPLG